MGPGRPGSGVRLGWAQTGCDATADLGHALIVLEATGGVKTRVASALAIARMPVVVVNPRQVRAFAQATGILAKTDRLDAQVLAHFAAVMQPTPPPPQ